MPGHGKYYDVDEYNAWKRKQSQPRIPPRANFVAAATYLRKLLDGKNINWAALGGLSLLCLGSKREMVDIHVVFDARDFERMKSKLEKDDRMKIPKSINSLFAIKILMNTGPKWKDSGCTENVDIEVNLLPPGSNGTPTNDVLKRHQVMLQLNSITSKKPETFKALDMLYLMKTFLQYSKSEDYAWDSKKDITWLCMAYPKDVLAIRQQLDSRMLQDLYFSTPYFSKLSPDEQRKCAQALLGTDRIPTSRNIPTPPQHTKSLPHQNAAAPSKSRPGHGPSPLPTPPQSAHGKFSNNVPRQPLPYNTPPQSAAVNSNNAPRATGPLMSPPARNAYPPQTQHTSNVPYRPSSTQSAPSHSRDPSPHSIARPGSNPIASQQSPKLNGNAPSNQNRPASFQHASVQSLMPQNVSRPANRPVSTQLPQKPPMNHYSGTPNITSERSTSLNTQKPVPVYSAAPVVQAAPAASVLAFGFPPQRPPVAGSGQRKHSQNSSERPYPGDHQVFPGFPPKPAKPTEYQPQNLLPPIPHAPNHTNNSYTGAPFVNPINGPIHVQNYNDHNPSHPAIINATSQRLPNFASPALVPGTKQQTTHFPTTYEAYHNNVVETTQSRPTLATSKPTPGPPAHKASSSAELPASLMIGGGAIQRRPHSSYTPPPQVQELPTSYNELLPAAPIIDNRPTKNTSHHNTQLVTQQYRHQTPEFSQGQSAVPSPLFVRKASPNNLSAQSGMNSAPSTTASSQRSDLRQSTPPKAVNIPKPEPQYIPRNGDGRSLQIVNPDIAPIPAKKPVPQAIQAVPSSISSQEHITYQSLTTNAVPSNIVHTVATGTATVGGGGATVYTAYSHSQNQKKDEPITILSPEITQTRTPSTTISELDASQPTTTFSPINYNQFSNSQPLDRTISISPLTPPTPNPPTPKTPKLSLITPGNPVSRPSSSTGSTTPPTQLPEQIGYIPSQQRPQPQPQLPSPTSAYPRDSNASAYTSFQPPLNSISHSHSSSKSSSYEELKSKHSDAYNLYKQKGPYSPETPETPAAIRGEEIGWDSEGEDGRYDGNGYGGSYDYDYRMEYAAVEREVGMNRY